MRKLCLTRLCFLVCLFGVNAQLEIDVMEPRISTFLNRITNTTFDVIRGGIDIFSRAVDNIINKFAGIEERLRALLELFRKQLIKGVPELNIPVLDPLHINRIDFDLKHEAAKVAGNVQDVTVRHISKFVVTKEKFSDLGLTKFNLELNLTFPSIFVNGTYKIDGLIGDQFRIYGDGPFKLNLINLKVGTVTVLKFNLPAKLRVNKIDIDVKLGGLQNNFEHLMKDEEVGQLYNRLISKIAPEALEMIWPEIKPSVQLQIKKYINNILASATVVNIAKRLFNLT